MKTFDLKRKGETFTVIVDDEDYPYLMELHKEVKWKVSSHGYVVRQTRCGQRKVATQRLHRLLLGLDSKNRLQGEHLNRNKLDNRRSNLTTTVNGLNNKNKSTSTRWTSKFVGVSKGGRNRGWLARVSFAKDSVYIGYFKTERQAAIAFCEACLMFWDKDSHAYQSRCAHNLRLLESETASESA